MPPGTAGYTRVNGLTHKDAAYNPTQRALHPLFPKLTVRTDISFTANVPPTLSLVLTPEMVFYLIVRATGPKRRYTGLLFAPEPQSIQSLKVGWSTLGSQGQRSWLKINTLIN